MKRILAIDPGESGGLALFHRGKIIAIPMPGEDDLITQLATWDFDIAYIELVGGFIGDAEKSPGSRMFNFGDGYGFVRGAIKMRSIEVKLVPPQKWMRAVLPGVIGKDKSFRKKALQAFAQSLYTDLKVTLKTADALGLLTYAMRAEAGEFKRAGVVAIGSGDYRADSKAAVAWAKKAGYAIPKRGGKDFVAMVNYFNAEIRGK